MKGEDILLLIEIFNNEILVSGYITDENNSTSRVMFCYDIHTSVLL